MRQRAQLFETGVLLTCGLFCVVAGGGSPHAMAQGLHCHGEGQDASIATDRPSFTNASTVVPCHSLQVESGLLVSTDRKQRGYDAPEVAARFGLTPSTELRLGLPDYFEDVVSGSSPVTGLGDTTAGVKQSLAATKSGFNLAVVGALSFPTGARAVTSHGYDPTVQILPSQKLPRNLSVGCSFAVAWPTQAGSRVATGQSSAAIDWQALKRMDVFVEYAGSFPSQGKPRHTVDFGALYRPTRRQQIDFRSGFGLSSAAVHHFLGVGYAIRFDL